MTVVLITYRVRAEYLDEHLALLGAVHAELQARDLAAVRWETFRRDDGRSFVDFVRTDRPGRFSSLTSWSAFRSTLEDRCEAPPEMLDLKPVQFER